MLLLLAGFACDGTFWTPAAARLESRYRVIRPDNRGCGRSSSPSGAYTVAEMADDASAVLDDIGIGRAHVAGHSMGGEIAQELALRHPERVKSLALLSTSARSSERLKGVVETSARMPLQASPEICCRAFLPWLFTEAFFEIPGAVDAALARMMGNPHPPTPQGLAGQSAAIGSFDASERVKNIRCPTLVLVGKDDILTPPAWSRDLAGRILGAELLVLDPGAHDLVNETPMAVCAALSAFLIRLAEESA